MLTSQPQLKDCMPFWQAQRTLLQYTTLVYKYTFTFQAATLWTQRCFT